jgi:hypothetical protein
MALQFGRLVTDGSGVFSLTVVGDGTSTSVVVDLSKGPLTMDLKGATPVGVMATAGGTKGVKLSVDKTNAMQLHIDVDAPALLAGQLTDVAGFLTFAGTAPPPPPPAA